MWAIIAGAFFALLGIGLVVFGVVMYGQTGNPINFITMAGGLICAYQGGSILGVGIADRY